jgi:Fe-S cluster assembly protein SufB
MAQPDILNLDQDYKQKYGFYDDIQPVFQTERGLTRRVVEEISHQKNEPKWMREFRLQRLRNLHEQADAHLGTRPVATEF